LSGLRAAQLSRGCSPRVDPSAKIALTAHHEVAERKVQRAKMDDPRGGVVHPFSRADGLVRTYGDGIVAAIAALAHRPRL